MYSSEVLLPFDEQYCEYEILEMKTKSKVQTYLFTERLSFFHERLSLVFWD